MAFWSPPPPPPPAPFAGIDAIRRDAPVYLGMLALGFLPALDLSSIEGAAASARIGFVFSIAVGTVYLGCRRQDMTQDDVSSVSLLTPPPRPSPNPDPDPDPDPNLTLILPR